MHTTDKQDNTQNIDCTATLPLTTQTRLEFWKIQVQRWTQSNLTQTRFCNEQNIKHHQFVYWRNKIQGKEGKPKAPKSGFPKDAFIPVQLDQQNSESSLTVSLPNGIVLSGISENNITLTHALIAKL